ncbi:MAG: type II secretion system F family protein [bacterium]
MEFKYTARTKEGQVQKGTIQAPSKSEAIAVLQARNLIILDIGQGAKGMVLSKEITIFNRVSGKEKVSFSRQLSTLFSARIPLLEALRVLARQTPNRYFSQIIFDVANEVEGGNLLSKALTKYPKVFSDFFVNMVRSGEISGGLDKTLNYLADYLEKNYYMNSKIKAAMAYPAFILSGFIVVGTLMMILVVPQLTSFLKETGQALPLPTKILIATSGFMQKYWWLIVLFVAGVIGGVFGAVTRLPEGRRIFDMLKIKTPIFGRIFRGIYLARLTDNLSTLIEGGLPILQALQVTGEVVGNVIYKKIIFEAKENVRIGNTISDCFAQYEEIPPMVTQMLATGEKTGSVEEILRKLSGFYTKEVDAMLGTLSQLIEPILIVILGIGVATLVASILIPIYNIASGM